MLYRLSQCAAALAVASVLAAQTTVMVEQIGGIGPRNAWRHNLGLSIRDGGFGNFRFVTAFLRRDHAGWATNTANSGQHRIDGIYFFPADSNGATQNIFTLWIYAEDPTNPGNPDPASAQGPFGPFGTPGGGTGALFYPTMFQFPTPVLVPNTGDVYMGFEFSSELQTDRMSAMATSAIDLTGNGIPNHDIGNNDTTNTGHGQGVSGGYTYVLSPTTSAVLARWEFQLMVTPLATQAGFHVGATTPQLVWPVSNGPAVAANGSMGPAPSGFTTSFISGLQPSLLTDRLGANRMDDLYLLYENPNLPPDTFVGFALSGLGPATLPLGAIFAGSTGSWCVDPAAPFIDIGVSFTNNDGLASLAIPVGSVQSRTGLIMAGVPATFTAIGIDFMNQTIHAGACTEVSFF